MDILLKLTILYNNVPIRSYIDLINTTYLILSISCKKFHSWQNIIL